MRLYKFKSLQNFEHIADILCNNNLYASKFMDLNDPMEGMFEHFGLEEIYLDQIRSAKERVRICALSATMESPLLWAHYADGFKGICIEFDVGLPSNELVKVKYSEFNYIVDQKENFDTYALSRKLLSGKSQAWDYEKEYRILSNTEKISRGIKIKAILFGLRTPEASKKAVIKLCPSGVSFYETKIDSSQHKIIRQKISTKGSKKLTSEKTLKISELIKEV